MSIEVMLISFGYGAFVVASLLAVGHWINHPDKKRLPGNVWNLFFRYIYGTSTLWLGQLVFLGHLGQLSLAFWLLGLNCVGGLVVLIAYGIDDYVTTRNKAKQAERSDDELS